MRWTLKPKPSEETVKHLAKALNVEDFVATLLVQRGINTLRKQERPSLEIYDPFFDERYGKSSVSY
jgi:single-stranded-DNA-specific exonuclease